MARPRKRKEVPGDSPIVTLPDDRMYERRNPIDLEGVMTSKDGPSGPAQRQTDEEVLVMARKRFQMSSMAESTIRKEMLIDQRFYASQQWPDQTISDRTNDRRPILTINRLPQFVKQITNPQRQARPGIQVNPVGDGATKDVAEVMQGLIRHIERVSHADVAYDEAYEDAVIIGRGWFRILTQFIHDGTFDQEIIVKRIPNALAVYPDPAAMELDYSDMRFCFIVEDIPKDEYTDLYGKDSMTSLEMFSSMGNAAPDWMPEGRVRIAEYFWVEMNPVEICMVQSELGDQLVIPKQYVPDGATILKTRMVQQRAVHWAKINGAQILERKIWPGQWIPMIPVLGDELIVDGVRTYVGIVRNARDPQRMYNYWNSALTETIALAPRSPIIGAEGQFKGHEAEWKMANTKNIPYLEYVPISLDGKPVGAPQRQQFEPPISAIVQATRQADNDLKAVIGFYDASLGQPGPDQSGKAILARQKQGETANVNFIDNLGRSLWHAGRVYLDLIPKVFDTPRAIHILGGDDQQKVVIVNEDWIKDGVSKFLDVRLGRYDATISIGPSYQSRRQEAVSSMLQLVQAAPQLIPVVGDLMVAQMDWPGAEQIAERLKKALPPQLQEGDNNGQPQIPPEVQQKMQMVGQQMQQMATELQRLQGVISSKQMEIDSRERIAMLQTQAEVAIAMAKNGSAQDHAVLDQEFQKFTMAVSHLQDLIMQREDQAHQAAMASVQAGHQSAIDAQQQQADQQQAETAAQQQAAAAQASPTAQ